jgi:fumarylacetoacetase
VPEGSDFPLENLPYGIFSPVRGAARGAARAGAARAGVARAGVARAGVAIGEHVLDLAAVLADPVFARPTLNGFLARGRDGWSRTRAAVTALLSDESQRALVEPALYRLDEVSLHLPVEVADFVDFYASEQHAANLGRILRPGQPPLPPSWKHLPAGYHGRAGTIVPSGTLVTRPCGQRLPGGRLAGGPLASGGAVGEGVAGGGVAGGGVAGGAVAGGGLAGGPAPVFGPSGRLDIEAEVGFVVGTPSQLGRPVPAADFREHVFGVVLVNDWSARDIQAWEYVPLGPFLGKSFATSVSPWVVPLEALDAAWVPGPRQDPAPLPYLTPAEPRGLDIALEVELNGQVVSRPPFREMYWSPAQMLAHLTVNGASLRTGDIYASGTVSGPERDQRGSFIELAWNGAEPLRLPDGTERTFLQDGDTVTIRASARGTDGGRIGFGAVTGTIAPAPGTIAPGPGTAAPAPAAGPGAAEGSSPRVPAEGS